MFIDRPSGQVKGAAAEHLDGPVQLAIPVSWGVGLSTAGIVAFLGGIVVVGTVMGTFGLTWIWAAVLCVYFSWFLARATSGTVGRAILAMTAPSTAGRQVVALRARGWSTASPNGGLHKTYPAGTEVRLESSTRWWQSLRCRVGDDVYFIKHNHIAEVIDTLSGESPGGGYDV